MHIARSNALALALTTLGAIVFAAIAATGQSADMLALWMGGRMFDPDLPHRLYAEGDIFTMKPPAVWFDVLLAEGFDGKIFPFLYPPLWAWAVSGVASTLDFETVRLWIGAVNGVVLSATLFLLARLLAAPEHRVRFVIAGLGLAVVSDITRLALFQNQAQIAVSLLCVLFIFGVVRDRPWLAGIALAVAASIKLYPALLILPLLLDRRWRVVGVFGVTGLGLGLLSLAVGGWPLHAAFLETVQSVSRTALVARPSFSLDTVIASLSAGDSLTVMRHTETGVPGQWAITPKTPIWQLVSRLALLAGVVFIAWAGRQRSRDPLYWIAALTTLTLLLPLGWIYYFIPALLAAPVFVLRDRPALAALALILFAGLTSDLGMGIVASRLGLWYFLPLYLCFVALAVAYWRRALTGPRPEG